MFMTFFKFELRTWLRAPMPWIFLLVFALLTFLATASDTVSIGGSFGNIYKNAPFVTQSWYAVFSILALLLLTAFMNTAAIRDFERQTDQIVFSKPIHKFGYYFGHFFGGLIVSIIPMLGVSLGMWLGVAANNLAEWVDLERFGPFEVLSHWNSLTTIVIPNAIFAGSILFTIAILTRSTLYSFISAMVLLVAYIVAGNVIQDIDNEQMGALLDPFGFRAFNLETKYWTVDDKNSLSLGLNNRTMLLNRLLWIAVGMGILFLGYLRFSFTLKSRRTKKQKITNEEAFPQLSSLDAIPKINPVLNSATRWRQFMHQYKANLGGLLKSVPFFLLSFIGIVNTLGSMAYATEGYNTHNLPVTYTMIDMIRGSFYLFSLSILAYFTGELVWRERRAKVNEIYDAMPTRNWTGYAAKLLTIITALALLQVFNIGAGVATQALNGFSRFELGVYFRELLVFDLLQFAFLAVLFLLIQALSPNMYLGFFLCVVFIIVNDFIWDVLHVVSGLAIFGDTPNYTISDLYGYRPFQKGLFWFNTYWILFCGALATATICFWPRGKETTFAKKWKLAGLEWPRYKWLGIGSIALWGLCGAWIYYNTLVLHTLRNSKQNDKLLVRYEKEYKYHEGRIQPRIYKTKYHIELYPKQRKVDATGTYWVHNPHDKTIDTLVVQTPNQVKFGFSTDRLKLIKEDKPINLNVYVLEPALLPGDSISISFKTTYEPRGFENEVSVLQIVQNGSFFNNKDIAPEFGYNPRGEMNDRNDRKKYKLPEKTRLPVLNPKDTFNRRNSYIAIDADWVDVETVIGTSNDQIAIAPGSLRKEWQENNRNYFEYKLDRPSLNFYSFMSAKYEVARKKWNDIDLEVYYHHEHQENVDRMLKAMEKSLEYYTNNFGPYFHKQCRIIEFPRYASFAQAFPGTMPYSESIGFIEDYREEEDDIDMVFYVVAHEMAHQWWAHQECGALMQGGEMTVETFAQYGALMVMEKEYGKDIMRKFLAHESDRYLRGRGRERIEEMPLARCENQGYIHYNKGSLVMYYLKEMIGEEQVNQALRNFLEQFKYAPPPYPVTSDAVAEFARYTPDSLKYIIDDLFWDITLFENRTEAATAKALDNGQYEVTINVTSKKLKADGKGAEKEVTLNDWIDIGAFAKPEGHKKYGKTLYRKRIKMNLPQQTFTFVVDEEPDEAGIDPFKLLIDRNPEDNMRDVDIE